MIRPRESAGVDITPATTEHRRRPSSLSRSGAQLQSDEEPGPSVSGACARGKKISGRDTRTDAMVHKSAISPQRAGPQLQVCPKICHRSPSPSHNSGSADNGPSPISHKNPGRPTSLSRGLTTPVGRLRIYDDLLSPSRQPQTPEQLPEARHQSRLPESYTAPVGRFRTVQAANRTPSNPQRLRHRRGPSPMGMRTQGFEGLYGGRENGDDVALFDEASQARQEGSSSPGRSEPVA